MARFCPICGKSESQAQFYGELCAKCAELRMPPLPKAEVWVCKKCGRTTGKKGFRKDASLEEEVARAIKLKNARPKFSSGFASVEYDSAYGRITRQIEVSVRQNTCLECAKASTQYFEAIIQLRGEQQKVRKLLPLLQKRIAARSFIPKIEELKEGIDIYCGSRAEAIASLNSFGLGFLRTEKLAGQKDGRRLYRTTLLVRME
ncbi:MAG: 60S ribosomal export protein NMD3 [Candidatus Micrarchaeota archaeon]|nr:60S ribosomal export protein NMD3 [Candidatus Micrarchaeota archaeon]